MVVSRQLCIVLALSWGAAAGCGQSTPQSPGVLPPKQVPEDTAQVIEEIAGELPAAALGPSAWPAGSSLWSWHLVSQPQDNPTPRSGMVQLEITGLALRSGSPRHYRWLFQPPITAEMAEREIRLTPRQPDQWLSLVTVPGGWTTGQPPLPLPRWPVAGPAYGDLVQFVKEMTANRFESVVCHWPKLPIPVRLDTAQSGEVDLAACLAEAVDRWNEGERNRWFRVQEDASWGVRLVHFPGAILRPPMFARITRLDDQGRPLRINIITGNNYDDPQDRPYAVRALTHELGHALFLWGHSRDRNHILWEAGPPLVDGPSPAERKAARLWHGLPDGLDLKNYLSGS